MSWIKAPGVPLRLVDRMAESPTLMEDLRRQPAPTVVLVDDDDALRAALRFSLEIDGYQVESCRSGEQLLELELPGRPACLVLDYKLPGLSGLDALEELRRRGVSLAAILVTSYASPKLRLRARELQAEVVEKPLLGDALLARIHAALPLA